MHFFKVEIVCHTSIQNCGSLRQRQLIPVELQVNLCQGNFGEIYIVDHLDCAAVL